MNKAAILLSAVPKPHSPSSPDLEPETSNSELSTRALASALARHCSPIDSKYVAFRHPCTQFLMRKAPQPYTLNCRAKDQACLELQICTNSNEESDMKNEHDMLARSAP